MKIGYARVSTEEQNLDIQLTALRKSGCKKIYQEKISGTKWERPELHKMLNSLQSGDIVVVWRLDRLARSTKMLLEITDRIMDSKAKFTSLLEPWADTTSPAGKMIMNIFAGMAEFERDLIRARTGAGRTEAIKRGVKFGRPSKMAISACWLELSALGPLMCASSAR
ncbi:MAG TPA: recombinase family protein [Candidatus Obscuribacterales bacterium]